MVKTGSEEKFKEAAEQKLSSLSTNSPKLYFLKKQMQARSGLTFIEPLFPGYIFMETEKLLNDISEKTTFITPEILKCEYSVIKKYIEEDSRLKEYSFDLEGNLSGGSNEQ